MSMPTQFLMNSAQTTIASNTPAVRGAYVPDGSGQASGNSVRVINPSDTLVFVRSGDSTVVAAATDCPIRPLSEAILAKNPGDTHISAYNATGAKTIYVQVGSGF